MVGRAEERPESEAAFAGVREGPLCGALRDGSHCCGDGNSENGSAVLVLQQGKGRGGLGAFTTGLAAEGGCKFLHDIALEAARGIQRGAGEGSNEYTH